MTMEILRDVALGGFIFATALLSVVVKEPPAAATSKQPPSKSPRLNHS